MRRRLAGAPYHISFSELDKLQYYEYEMLIKDINEDVDKENERIMAESSGMVPIINFDQSKPKNI